MKDDIEEPLTFVENFSLVFQLALRLKSALKNTNKFFPMSEEKLEELSEEDITLIDTLIYRFSKLQDLLGEKIFRTIIILDKEKAEAMRDVINKMEKKYIIESTVTWDAIRKVRNDVVHQYVPKGKKAAETLNNIVFYTPDLLEILVNICKYAQDEIGIDMSNFDITELKIKE